MGRNSKGSLRKVMSGATNERLSCGHVIPRKQDIYGPTNAHKRRCWKCAQDLPLDTEPDDGPSVWEKAALESTAGPAQGQE